jgi:hypothetical protein
VAREAGYGSGWTGFDDVTEIHDGDAVAEMFDHGQVMGDEEVGQAALFLEVLQEVDHLRLHRDIERADRFVTDDESGFHREGTGNANALALAAAELVRVPAALSRIESDIPHEFADPPAAFGAVAGESMNINGFANDRFDREARVQRAGRVLKDHLAVASMAAEVGPAEREQVEAVEPNPAGGGPHETDDGAAECGFAATAFADQAQGFASGQFEVYAINGLNEFERFAKPTSRDGEVDLEIANFEKFHGRTRA